MQKIIDLDKLVRIRDVCLTSTLVAFDNDKHVNEINNDLNSIKIALNNYTKIFVNFNIKKKKS